MQELQGRRFLLYRDLDLLQRLLVFRRLGRYRDPRRHRDTQPLQLLIVFRRLGSRRSCPDGIDRLGMGPGFTGSDIEVVGIETGQCDETVRDHVGLVLPVARDTQGFLAASNRYSRAEHANPEEIDAVADERPSQQLRQTVRREGRAQQTDRD